MTILTPLRRPPAAHIEIHFGRLARSDWESDGALLDADSNEQVTGDLVDQGLPSGEPPDLVAGQRERANRGAR